MKKVTIENSVIQYEEGTSYQRIMRDHFGEKADQVILVKVDGKLEELTKILKGDCTLEPVYFTDKPGYNSYRRSVSFLMMKAIYDLYTKEEIGTVRVMFSIGSGLFCSLSGNIKPDHGFTRNVEKKMRELVDKEIPIDKDIINTQEAIARFLEYGMKDKAELFRYRRASKVNIYSIGGFQDYYYGYMVPDTSYLKWFSLEPYEDGFVLQFPKRTEPGYLRSIEFSKKVFDVMHHTEDWARMLEVSTVGELNNMISKGNLSEMILVQEAIQEKQIGDIAGMIAKDPTRRIIMIAGPSSSGKTTFSHRLSVQLRAHGLKPHPIASDNYFVERVDTPKDENGKYNFECLGAMDLELFNDQMNRLLRGETVEIPEFNFVTGQKEYKGKQILTLGKEDVLVIEGIHCLNDALSSGLPMDSKFKIYISALTMLNIDEHNRIPTTDGRLIRRIIRDARTRGSSARNTIDMWQSVRKGEEENIFPYQESADVVFNSALIYELSVLKQYAEPLLFGITPDDPTYIEAKRLLKFLDYFVGVDSNLIPNNSILREFIGGSCFRV